MTSRNGFFFCRKKGLFLLFAFAVLFQWQCLKSNRPGIPEAVQKVIRHAGLNKPELMKAIGVYVEDKDSLKLKALYGLMAQMGKNYTVYYSVQDTLGNHYFFPPEKFGNYLSLKHAWDSTEQLHGNLIYHADSFRVDAQNLSGDYLIKNINEAFRARKVFPWSKSYDFRTFCHWILPYRVANEPVESFRKHFLKEYGPLPERFSKPDVHTLDVALYLNRLVNAKIDYSDTYNKSLNTQSIGMLEKSGKGNFYDINIYKVKVMRAFGIAAALDYTPFLADTNFGYAYTTVILPDHNELILQYPHRVPHLQQPGRLAKLYRRTFFRDSASLYSIKKITTSTPPFLGDFYYSDITNSTNSVTVWVRLNDTAKYAYLSVFNDGGWRPVSWALVHDSTAVFKKTGKNIVYLPVGYRKHQLIRLGAPFLLNPDGIKIFLHADFSSSKPVKLTRVNAVEKLSAGENYILYYWNGNWKTLDAFTVGEKGYTVSLPAGGLFFLSNDDIDFNERIFIINSNGQQQFY
jgi:hypothetical protein